MVKKYTLTLEAKKSRTIKAFRVKSDAEREKKALIKKHNLKRQRGFWGNSSTGTELSTNY